MKYCLCLEVASHTHVAPCFRQEGTSLADEGAASVMAADGSVILVGFTSGNWTIENVGNVDFAAAKVDPESEEVWRWQARHSGHLYPLERRFSPVNCFRVSPVDFRLSFATTIPKVQKAKSHGHTSSLRVILLFAVINSVKIGSKPVIYRHAVIGKLILGWSVVIHRHVSLAHVNLRCDSSLVSNVHM